MISYLDQSFLKKQKYLHEHFKDNAKLTPNNLQWSFIYANIYFCKPKEWESFQSANMRKLS